MTITDQPVTHCPDWCVEKDATELHPDLHESRMTYVDRPGKHTLFVSAVLSARPDNDGRPTVALHSGDDEVLRLTASEARSLAAGLIRHADIAEGHTRA